MVWPRSARIEVVGIEVARPAGAAGKWTDANTGEHGDLLDVIAATCAHTSMRETLDLAKELNCEFANFYSAMAYPGSPLYKMAVEKGWDLPESWGGYSQHSYDSKPLRTEKVPAASVIKFRDEAFHEGGEELPLHIDALDRAAALAGVVHRAIGE